MQRIAEVFDSLGVIYKPISLIINHCQREFELGLFVGLFILRQHFHQARQRLWRT